MKHKGNTLEDKALPSRKCKYLPKMHLPALKNTFSYIGIFTETVLTSWRSEKNLKKSTMALKTNREQWFTVAEKRQEDVNRQTRQQQGSFRNMEY